MEISAFDDGLMEYYIESIGLEDVAGVRDKGFANIALKTGKKMSSEISSGVDASSVKIYVLDNKKQPVKEVLQNGFEVAVSTDSGNNNNGDGGNGGSGGNGGNSGSGGGDSGGGSPAESGPTSNPMPTPIVAITPNPTLIPMATTDPVITPKPESAPGSGSSLTSGTVSGRAMPPVPRDTKNYADVSKNHWAYYFIRCLTAYGIIDGYPQDDGTFIYCPENEITRAEIIKLISAALELPLEEGFEGSEFADWDNVEDWAKPYVGAAVKAGIVYGAHENDGLFVNANNNITRQEMIAMAVRALKIDVPEGGVPDVNVPEEGVPEWSVPDRDIANLSVPDVNVPDVNVPDMNVPDISITERGVQRYVISDFDDADDWARDVVAFALNNGMINSNEGKVRPLENAKRSEAAMLLYKMLEFITR